MAELRSRHDVIIAGAGPAGSTAANFLSQAGHDVVVLERDHFPRFHVGESMLPANQPIFDALGVDLEAAGYLKKRGAWFLDEANQRKILFSFDQGLEGTPPIAYQVDRASFDLLLLDRARECGFRLVDLAITPTGVMVE